MLKRLVTTIAAVAFTSALIVAGPVSGSSVQANPADPPAPVTCSSNPTQIFCQIALDGSDDAGGPRNEATGFTPAPRVCTELPLERVSGGVDIGERIKIDCERDGAWWSNSRQCYVSVSAAQGPPLLYAGQDGAYYDCQHINYPIFCQDFNICARTTTFWSATTPPGITIFTPVQAANQLVRSFNLVGVNIGLAPDPDALGSRGYVGLPVWMWVKDPTEASYGPYRVTETLGGVTVTAEANVTSIIWNMGDGASVPCAGPGTAYQSSLGLVDSPSCGYRYKQISAGQPGGQYTVTATSQWEVAWEAEGQAAVIPLTTEQATNVAIRELQSVNVGN